MAADRKVGHNSVSETTDPIGRVVIDFSGSAGLRLYTEGVMNDPAFLEMASGYLRQYIDRCWQEVWEERDKRITGI